MNLPTTGWPGPDQQPSSNMYAWGNAQRGNRSVNVGGWPTGSMRTPSNPAHVLATAEAWWDASNYERDSGLWRNLGTAGASADLIRPSVLRMEWLAPEVSRYWWNPGLNNVGGVTSTLSCTAPATATSYIAYTFDQTTLTGAVTGGSAFSFSSRGRWLRVDLLNSSAAVVASFEAALTSATGMTDAYGVVWTLNLAANVNAYIRGALMETRESGERHCFQLGIGVQSGLNPNYGRWQCSTAGSLFDVNFGQDVTVLVVVKHVSVASTYGDYISWVIRQAVGSEGGVQRWAIGVGNGVNGYSEITGTFNGLTALDYDLVAQGKLNKRICFASRTIRSGRLLQSFVNGTLYTTTAQNAALGFKEGGALLTIGNNSTNSGWNGPLCQLYAVAFFRRSLSDRELADISAYYSCE